MSKVKNIGAGVNPDDAVVPDRGSGECTLKSEDRPIDVGPVEPRGGAGVVHANELA